MIEAENEANGHEDTSVTEAPVDASLPKCETVGRRAAVTATALISIVILFQWALACGAPWGQYTQSGAHEGQLPATSRVLAVVSSALLLTMAVSILARAGLGPMKSTRRWIVTSAVWVSAAYFAVAILLNAATPSPSERALWLPISLAIFALVAATIWSTRASRSSRTHTQDSTGTADE